MRKSMFVVLMALGCAEMSNLESEDYHFHEQEVPFSTKDRHNSVRDVIRARSCSTGALKALDIQIAQSMSCLSDTPLGRIDADPNLRMGEGVRPHLQAEAAEALKQAARALGSITLTSGWRSVAQQHVLKSWEGSCGIGIAATPGRSHHQSGLAIDTGDFRNRSVRTALINAGFEWYCDVRNGGRLGGCADPVHFVYGSGQDLRDLSVLAFQKLWNLNHPDDPLAEDGAWGPSTAAKLELSPIAGFSQTFECGDADRVSTAVHGPNQCEENPFPASFGYEACEESEQEIWRCACNADLGITVSQVCRGGAWINHHLNPMDCGQCNDQTSAGCRSVNTRTSEDILNAVQICGDGHLSMSETGQSCAEGDEGVWRCACSANIGDVVSQVCRNGEWTNYRVGPNDCATCQGDYGPGCEP